MTNRKGTAVIRSMKILHFLLTILLFAVGCRLFYSNIFIGDEVTIRYGTAVLIYFVILLFCVRTYSAYNVGSAKKWVLILSQTLACAVSACIMYLLVLINQRELIDPLPMVGVIALQLVLNFIWSYCTDFLFFRLQKTRKAVLIYRNSSDLRRMNEVKEYKRRFEVIGEIIDPPDDLDYVAERLAGAEDVFVSGVNATLRNGILKYCVEQGICCYVIPHVGDVIMMGSRRMELFSAPFFRVMRAEPNIEYMIIKRFMDIVLSVILIILLSPVILITALAIKIYDRGPVLYKQVRLTKEGKTFRILKFRSMRVNAEEDGVARMATENDSRITPVGKVIRACRVDELPQLFNILRGDMSIVGPRPERPEIAKQYEEFMPSFALRLQVKAGLTGLAQIYGRYNTDPNDKLKMDLMYINQMSLMQDIRLIFATVKVLFMKDSTRGVAEGQKTAVANEEEKKYIYK